MFAALPGIQSCAASRWSARDRPRRSIVPPNDTRIAFGVLSPTANRSDVTADSPSDHVARGLVPVLEGRRLFHSLSVEENLVIGAVGRGLDRTGITAALEEVYGLFPRLAARRHSRAGLISGGEQQMCAIGRGLMAQPKLFLLDEPSMGLAPLVVAEIFDTLTRLNRLTGLTILVAEQNSAVALRHAHDATVIENGRSVLSGPAADLARRADIQARYLGGPAPAAA